MILLDGKKLAGERMERLTHRVQELQAQKGRPPHLGVILVGRDPASEVYVRNKMRACERVGIHSSLMRLGETIDQKELNDWIDRCNQDQNMDGVLVQFPLPSHLSGDYIHENLSLHKDVDGFTFRSLGYLWGGRPLVAPCTPQGIMTLLNHYRIPLSGTHAVVVGRSTIVGKPMAYLLTQADATVTLCHSRTGDLSSYTRQGDLVIVAAGKKGLLGKSDFRQGAVVVDVGLHRISIEGSGQQLCGDVRFEELEGWVKACTPVPGGVGPMTIISLLENTVKLFEVHSF